MKIAIDCDGVLADFTKAFTEVVNGIWPGALPADFVPVDWNYNGKFTPKELNMVWERVKATPNFWLGLDAYTENVGALALFLKTKKNHDIYICTSRIETVGLTIAQQTKLWLDACGVTAGHNYLGVVPVPSSDDKVSVYEAMGIEMSVDDKGETVEQCDVLPGHRAYLLDRPWNQEAEVKRRIKNLNGFLSVVQG